MSLTVLDRSPQKEKYISTKRKARCSDKACNGMGAFKILVRTFMHIYVMFLGLRLVCVCFLAEVIVDNLTTSAILQNHSLVFSSPVTISLFSNGETEATIRACHNFERQI